MYIFSNSIIADIADKFPRSIIQVFGCELCGADKQLISAATALPKYFNVNAESQSKAIVQNIVYSAKVNVMDLSFIHCNIAIT